MRLDLINLADEHQKYHQLVIEDPTDHHSMFVLPQIYQKQYRIDEAIKAYTKALTGELNPEYFYRMGQMYFDQRQHYNSLDCLLKALDNAQDDWVYFKDVELLIDEAYTKDSCSY